MHDQKQPILNNDVCQVLTASGWELVLYDCMRASVNSHLAIPAIIASQISNNSQVWPVTATAAKISELRS